MYYVLEMFSFDMYWKCFPLRKHNLIRSSEILIFEAAALVSIALELKNLEHKDMTVILCFSCAKLEFTSLLNKPVEKNLVFKDFDVLFFKYSDRKKEKIKEIGHLTTRICCFHFMKNISLQFVCCLNEFL